jgi:hypothetical protein
VRGGVRIAIASEGSRWTHPADVHHERIAVPGRALARALLLRSALLRLGDLRHDLAARGRVEVRAPAARGRCGVDMRVPDAGDIGRACVARGGSARDTRRRPRTGAGATRIRERVWLVRAAAGRARGAAGRAGCAARGGAGGAGRLAGAVACDAATKRACGGVRPPRHRPRAGRVRRRRAPRRRRVAQGVHGRRAARQGRGLRVWVSAGQRKGEVGGRTLALGGIARPTYLIFSFLLDYFEHKRVDFLLGLEETLYTRGRSKRCGRSCRVWR